LTASQIGTACSSRIIYQKIVSSNSIFMCDDLSTLYTNHFGDCSTGQRLWLSPASGNNPASYICYSIPPNPCTGSDVLYYDTVNQVYECKTITNINSVCSTLSKVDFRQKEPVTNLVYYSCQLQSYLPSLCTGTNLIFFNDGFNVYYCQTKADLLVQCDDAIYKKTNPITFYQCITKSALNSSKSSDCTGTQKLWLNPEDANTPESYACTGITSTQCQSQSGFIYYDNINYNVYSC
jgi:hypothetical protein